MKALTFWTLTLTLMAAATVLFGQQSFAAPAAKAKHILQARRVVVRLGKPYRAEQKTRAKSGELNLIIHCHADCNLPGEDANVQYLQWRNSVRFGSPVKNEHHP